MVSRRNFLRGLLGCGGLYHAATGKLIRAADLKQQRTSGANLIDRAALVARHNPVLHQLEPLSPLSLGNGEFAFTGDITGLQTFPHAHENAMPLCTMAQWGWHTTPLPRSLDPKALRLTQYDTHGRTVGYHTGADGQQELFNWLRENPHRLHLGRIGLRLLRSDQAEARLEDISEIEQRLDLWTGSLTSRFQFAGQPVRVQTSVHPQLDSAGRRD